MSGPTTERRYERAVRIAHALLDLPEGARAEALERACGEDAALRGEVEWMLRAAADEADDDAFELHAHAQLDGAALAAAAAREYRILRPLGEGGMGMVYLAERSEDGVRQLVALKLLRLAGAARGLSRFRDEQRILASLRHDNIAHFIDAGTLSNGQPFLAVEYVDGVGIDRWCAGQPLAARLRVFLKVCAAVSYAHAQLVIHRDLKPDNILVTGAGEPKLLDFGIARLLDDGGTRTLTAARVLTPAYASPEQIEGAALGTGTDVYSLGAVLYEIVTGTRPFAAAKSDHARAQAILAGDPVAPSRIARVPADIEAIVLRAMRREPSRRYASAAELADDLRRYLASQPVLARRGSAGYRLRRFAFRHRYVLAAGALVFVLVGTFIALTLVQLRRTTLAEQRAREQAAISDRAAEFLASVFSASDSEVNARAGKDLTAREVLDNGTERIERELAGAPPIQARLLEAVGNAYRHMHANAKAAALMRKAADLYLSPTVNQPEAAARCLEALANVMANGEFPARQAERAARESLALSERLTTPGSQPIANAWMVLSLALNRSGNYAAAQSAAETSLEMNRRRRTESDNRYAAALHNLCLIASNRGDQPAALRWCEQAIAAHGKGDDVGTILTRSRQATAQERAGDFPAAIATAERVLADTRKVYGEVSNFGALFEQRLAHVLNSAGQYARALTYAEQARNDQERLNGKDSGEYVGAVLEIARGHALVGEFERALPLLHGALEFRSAHYEADDPRVLATKTALAATLLDLGRAGTEARALLDEANAGWADKDDPGTLDAPDTLLQLARWQARNGANDAASALLDRIEKPAVGDPVTRAQVAALRADIARARGNATAALDAETTAVEILRASLGAQHPQTARYELALARSLRAGGRNTRAAAIEQAALPVVEHAFPAGSAFRRP